MRARLWTLLQWSKSILDIAKKCQILRISWMLSRIITGSILVCIISNILTKFSTWVINTFKAAIQNYNNGTSDSSFDFHRWIYFKKATSNLYFILSWLKIVHSIRKIPEIWAYEWLKLSVTHSLKHRPGGGSKSWVS